MKSLAGRPTNRSHCPASKVLRNARLAYSVRCQTATTGRPSASPRRSASSTYKPFGPDAELENGRLSGSAQARRGAVADSAVEAIAHAGEAPARIEAIARADRVEARLRPPAACSVVMSVS